MSLKIEKPENTVYWIAYSNDKQRVVHGQTLPTQVTETGLDNLDSYLTEAERDEVLLNDFGITIEKPSEEIDD
jgi:hypothetical protein